MSSPTSATVQPNWQNIRSSAIYALIIGGVLLTVQKTKGNSKDEKMWIGILAIILLAYGVALTTWSTIRMKAQHEKGHVGADKEWMNIVSLVGGVVFVGVLGWHLYTGQQKATENEKLLNLIGLGGLAVWIVPILANSWQDSA